MSINNQLLRGWDKTQPLTEKTVEGYHQVNFGSLSSFGVLKTLILSGLQKYSLQIKRPLL